MRKVHMRILAWGAVVLAMLGGIYRFAFMTDANSGLDPSRLATVECGTMFRSVVATGKVEPVTKVEIKSKANGIIEALHVEVGDLVQPGDILAELDQENLRARLREAEANLQAARAAVEVARAELRKNQIEAESPDVEYSRRAFRRAKHLFEQNLVSRSDLDQAESNLEVAENRRIAAESQLSISAARIAEAEANVAQAAALAERSREELANATIRAPIQGAVLTRDVEIGSPVSSILNLGSAATLVMTLGNIDQVFVRGKVDEADIGGVRLAQPARITVETFKGRAFEGKVTLISPIGSEKDNVTTFEVKVSIDNPAKDLRANMTANAEIILEEHPDTLIIPIAAVVFDAQKNPFVDVPANSGADGKRRVAVKLGIGNGTRTEVVEGLREGDRVLLP